MASQTLSSVADVWPVGTTVGAYPAANQKATWDRSGAPAGSATATAAVQSDGSVAFTGLADDTAYYASAQVSGTWRHRWFRTGPAATVSGGTVGGIEDVPGLQEALDAKQALSSAATDTELTAHVETTGNGSHIPATGITDTHVATGAAIAQSKVSGLTTDLAAKQASDADLTAIAGLSPTNDDVLQRKSGAWTNRTVAQVKTDLALVKGDVGLGNVDNTSDANKPVSTAQQTALNLKANLASPTFTGTPAAPTPTAGDNDTSIATTAFVTGALTTHEADTSSVHGVADTSKLMAVCLHNGTSYPSRPTAPTSVMWIGPTPPTIGGAGNATDNADVWIDTAV